MKKSFLQKATREKKERKKKDVTQIQQQRPELSTVTVTRHASNNTRYTNSTRGACQVRVTEGDAGLCCCVCVTSFER